MFGIGVMVTKASVKKQENNVFGIDAAKPSVGRLWTGAAKESAYHAMFSAYHTALLRFLRRRLPDVHTAEDIAQDTYHNVMRRDSLETTQDLKAYVFKTAANLAANRLRKKGREDLYLSLHDGEQYHDQAEAQNPERFVAAEKSLDKVSSAYQQLPEICRRAFEMNRFDSKSYSQISIELGVSVSSVEKYLMKTLAVLRGALSDHSAK